MMVFDSSLQFLVQPNFNLLLNVANALGNIANVFENNYSALESVSKGLKNAVTHFQCIFNAFSKHFRLISYDEIRK